MKVFLRIVLTLVFASLTALLIYFNCTLYYRPEFIIIGSDHVNKDVLLQLRYLRDELHDGAAEKMQNVFPEGFVFTNALYGLAWCDIAENIDHSSVLYSEAHEQINYAFHATNSDEGRIIFDNELPLPYGAFYNGWNSYLLGKKLSVEDEKMRDTTEISLFESYCSAISQAISKNSSPYPESYTGECWPADAVICVAALSLHDKLFSPLYSDLIEEWLNKVNSHLDISGQIPHAVEAGTGNTSEDARGSSQSLMLCFLPEIDTAFASVQFALYHKNFLQYHMGLPGIREYKKNTRGHGDIDSGPLLFHIGASATITGKRAFYTCGEKDISAQLRNTIEAFGFSKETADGKKYLGGKLPVADAFIAWVNANELENDSEISYSNHRSNTFQLYSTGIVLLEIILTCLIWKIPVFKLFRRKRITNT